MTLPTIPLFVNNLGGGDKLVGMVVGIFTFSALIIRPYAGHALESRGRGFVYLVGLAIFIISVGGFSFAAGIALLFMLRIIQGAGWGLSTTAGGTIATDIIPAERRGEGLGYFGLSGNIALAFGPSLGLMLVGYISFQQLFLICASFGLIAFILASRIRFKKAAASPDITTVKFDFFERTAVRPSLLLFFITISFGGISTFLPLHTMNKGVEGIQLYFLVFALFLMLSRTFAGRLYDRKGHLFVFIPGTLLVCVALLLLAWLPNMWCLLIAAAFYGLGFGGVQPALQAWAVEKASSGRKGMANATFFSSFDLGVGIGAIVFGQLAFLGYEMIYTLSAGSVFISILLYVYLLIRDKSMVE
ncbi:MFS transporter [Oceanobacillus piezotolerans]|uniref:MFS transporter n=2 Tax=Oceanobacillus piezotolerans TaxID=2448030 RepID=A0A498D4Q6_9BACI|nr:MFS transporter [Oceanobacillus piezotolerans]